MKITSEIKLRDFEFWSGAEDRAACLEYAELGQIETELEQLYPDGIDETALNDLFWFDFEFICEMIGTTEEDVLERKTA